MSIEYVDHGIANVIEGRIYMNHRLKAYPELHKRILAHEMEHINGADYTLDWKLKLDGELESFVLKNPSSWTQFLPIWFVGKKVIYSKTMLIVWVILAAVLCVGVSFNVWMASML